MRKIKLIITLAFILVIAGSCRDKMNEIRNKPSEKQPQFGVIDEASLPEIMTPELLWKMGRVSEIQLSPDKKTVLYGVTFYDLESNKSNRDLYTLPVEGGNPVKVTKMAGSEFNAMWSPDGKKIGFLAKDGENGIQLWEMNPDGSDCKVITTIKGGVSGFKYSPKMDHILFAKSVKLEQNVNDMYPDLPLANAHLADDLMYRHWDSWSDQTFSHVFVAPFKEGKVGDLTDIMEGEKFDSPLKPWGGMEQINWSNDGKMIAYTCKKLYGKKYAVSTNSGIYIYNLETGKTINLTEKGFEGYDQDPVFSPDNQKIAWRTMEEDGFEADKDRIYVYNFKDGSYTDYSKDFDQSSAHFEWGENSNTLYFISGIKATYQIWSLDLTSGKINQITNGDHDYNAFVLGDKCIIGTKTTMLTPNEIYKVDLAGKETQLGFTNKVIMNHIKSATIQKRWVKTTDNKEMLVWVVLPPNFDSTKKYPAILYCQGGPQSAVSQSFSFRWNFQMMAANGYIIVAPNRRGLPTFGQEWNDQISGDYGGQNMKDYLSAIDAVSKEPYVNADKLGCIGASYGGYSVYWLAGHHEKRFKVFLSHCGIYNFESMYGETEEYFFVNKDYEGAFWQKPKPKSYMYSPHLYVDKWDTPIMMISGENDFRIPYTQSLEAYNAAQLRGIPSRLLIFPEESHFVLKPQNSVLWQREFKRWLDTYLK